MCEKPLSFRFHTDVSIFSSFFLSSLFLLFPNFFLFDFQGITFVLPRKSSRIVFGISVSSCLSGMLPFFFFVLFRVFSLCMVRGSKGFFFRLQTRIQLCM